MRKWLADFMGFTVIAETNAKLTEENKALHLKCFQLQNEIILLQAAKRNAEAEPDVKRLAWEQFRDAANAEAQINFGRN
jgi:fructose 1,6-bisphosphatase